MSSVPQTHNMLIDDKFKSPEFKKASWDIIEKAPVHAIDTWQLGACESFSCRPCAAC